MTYFYFEITLMQQHVFLEVGGLPQDTLADGALNWLLVSEVLPHDVSLKQGPLLPEHLVTLLALIGH